MTMIYNGMELPAQPQDVQYDKALIFYAANNTISLIYTDDPFSLRTLEPLNFDGAYRNWEVYSLTEDGVWGNKNSGYSNYDGAVVNGIIWANYDVLDPDGNVYLAASEPLTLFVVTHTIHADLLERGVRPRIDVVQGDSLTRRVEFVLTAGSVPWNPPEDTAAALSYVRPDGAGKVYDKLPDGTTAYTVSGNRVRMMLLPELMEVSGDVMAALRIVRESDGRLLSSFPIDVVVEPEPSYLVRPANNDTPTEPDTPAAAMYLYGTPSETGNIGLRVGESVTYYDGAVAPNIDTVYTNELKMEYPVAIIIPRSGVFLDLLMAKSIVYQTGVDGNYQWGTADTLRTMLMPYDNTWNETLQAVSDNPKWLSAVGDNFAIWTNTDIKFEDGAVETSATEPIPVGEIVDTINGIPIYEVI